MFIARQPIFSRNLEVYGYELLYRSGHQSQTFDGVSSVHATAAVVGGLFEAGIDQIIENKKAFINFDAEFLHSDMPEIIGPERLIIEVLEDVVVDQALVARIKDLKIKNYKIALDDFVESYVDYPLVPFADIIKFDILQTPLDQIKAEVKLALRQKKTILAEKVETEAEFHKAKEMGFHLFQGYFFSKPNIVAHSNSQTTTKIQYLRLLTELKKVEPSYQILAEIIEKDMMLAYRLMRVIKGRAGDDLIYSIKRALTYMGLKELERWVSILMLRDLSSHKPQELMRMALVRTKFSELTATNGNLKTMKHEASMMGLFSTLDAMLDQNMTDALDGITIPISISDALIKESGALGPLISLLYAYEKGDWRTGQLYTEAVGVHETQLYKDYCTAIAWASEIMDLMT